MAGRYLVPAKAGAQHKACRKAGFLFGGPHLSCCCALKLWRILAAAILAATSSSSKA